MLTAVPSHTTSPPASGASATEAAARHTAEAFEAVFIGQMTKLMMESAETDGPFSGGHGEATFRGVLAEQLGTRIAARGGIGLAPHVMQEIIRLQGGNGDVA